MSNPPTERQGHSADVQMHLRVNGSRLRLAQLGPTFLILDDLADHPPGEAEIIMSVDGRVRRWQIDLPEGLSVKKPRTEIANCRTINGA